MDGKMHHEWTIDINDKKYKESNVFAYSRIISRNLFIPV